MQGTDPALLLFEMIVMAATHGPFEDDSGDPLEANRTGDEASSPDLDAPPAWLTPAPSRSFTPEEIEAAAQRTLLWTFVAMIVGGLFLPLTFLWLYLIGVVVGGLGYFVSRSNASGSAGLWGAWYGLLATVIWLS